MKGFRLVAAFVAVSVLVLATVWADGVSPQFGIHTFPDWDQALAGQLIRPVPADVFRDMVDDVGQSGQPLWPVEYREAEYFTPTLEPITEYEGEAGLVMSWGESDPQSPEGTRFAAAWDFVYPVDPDLNGQLIEFSIFPPVPSTLFSLNLIDANGNYREWIWHAGDPGEVPPGTWSDLLINPATGWSNWPTFGESPFISNPDPAVPFDLSTIQILRFNENIAWQSGFFPPPGQPLPDGWVWNAWNHVEVMPEPGTIVILGGAFLCGFLRRTRKR